MLRLLTTPLWIASMALVIFLITEPINLQAHLIDRA